MTTTVALVYTDDLLKYDFGMGHSLRQIRLKLARELIESMGLLEGPNVSIVGPAEGASDEEILKIHGKSYIQAVKELGAPGCREKALDFGLGTADNPVFEHMYERSAIHVAATDMGCRMVWNGEADHVFSLGGGFHHAMRSRASGFCILNDVAIAINNLLEGGVERVMYVDIDAHHGDGVQDIFYLTPQVLTVSFHEDGRYLFPGSGFIEEKGEDKGEGYAVNIPMPPYTRDGSYLYAFEQIVPPLMRAYKPQFLLTQMGADAHFLDPLTHLMLSTHAYERIAELYHKLSHELCGGKWVAIGGGGYDICSATRVWTLEFAKMLGKEVGDWIPEEWMELCRELGGKDLTPPTRLRDVMVEAEAGISPAVKQVVERVKETIFPYHGL